MKKLLIGLAIISAIASNVKANPWAAIIKTTADTKSVYDFKGLINVMKSSDKVCFKYKKLMIASEGYKQAFGNNKEFCTTKRAKLAGVVRLNKNNLDNTTFSQLLKAYN